MCSIERMLLIAAGDKRKPTPPTDAFAEFLDDDEVTS